MASLKSKNVNALGVTMPRWASDWRVETVGNSHWEKLENYRGGQLHRILRKSTSVVVGSQEPHTVRLSDDRTAEPVDEASALLNGITNFGRERWEALWTAIAHDARSIGHPSE